MKKETFAIDTGLRRTSPSGGYTDALLLCCALTTDDPPFLAQAGEKSVECPMCSDPHRVLDLETGIGDGFTARWDGDVVLNLNWLLSSLAPWRDVKFDLAPEHLARVKEIAKERGSTVPEVLGSMIARGLESAEQGAGATHAR